MGFHLESEDAVAASPIKQNSETKLHVVIPVLPRTSNHTDWDALRLHPNVQVTLVRKNEAIPPADLVILPGSKSVQSDLAFLRELGWEDYIARHLRYGGKVLGICGGFQMLGEYLDDPLGMENAEPSSAKGLGYIPMRTELKDGKQLKQRNGVISSLGNADIKGYEIHSGVSAFHQSVQHFATLENGELEGYLSKDKQIIGTYLHGLFDDKQALKALLDWAGAVDSKDFDYEAYREQEVARLAQSCDEHMDIDGLIEQCRVFQEKRL
jgi:adenosylcobyric acid synthase